MEDSQANQIDTWAIVEIMGRQQLAGYVRTATLGSACMLRVDVPELAEEIESQQTMDYEKGRYDIRPVKLEGVPAFTRYLGISAIFSLTPCTEEFARAAQKRMRARPPAVVDMPRALPAPAHATGFDDDDDDDDDDRDEIYDAE